MAPKSTMVREYRDRKEFERDANKLARDGWVVVSQSERTQRSGCGRILALGLFTLLFKPKPLIVVTYSRAA